MTSTYIVTGTISDGKTVTLDEPLPITLGRVRLQVQALPVPASPPDNSSTPDAELSAEELAKLPRGDGRRMLQGMRPVWEAQKARGFVPSTVEEVEAWIRAERDSWDE